MKINTHITNTLDSTQLKEKYDAQVKKILSDKNILAWILKYTVQEFMESSIQDIIASIEGTPEVASVPIFPGSEVAGMSNESKIPNEGMITYDIRFHAYTPGGETVKLIINLEAQKAFHPGYDLVSRGIFYCSRMLSSQLDVEFDVTNYDNIKKVYSIWICMDTPKKYQNTITKYSMAQTDLHGIYDRKANYDLLSVIMVRLGATSDDSMPLLRLLETLLNEVYSSEEKQKILRTEYGIETTREVKEGISLMCNLSELVEERGIERGRQQEREQGISAMITSFKELGITAELTQQKVMEKFSLNQQQVMVYMQKYWV